MSPVCPKQNTIARLHYAQSMPITQTPYFFMDTADLSKICGKWCHAVKSVGLLEEADLTRTTNRSVALA